MIYDYYDIYFDPAELIVDQDGHLVNPEVLQIIEYGIGQVTDELIYVRRVDLKGNVLEDPWKDLENSDKIAHVGEGDDTSIRVALSRFDKWLDQNLEWRESWRGDYYNPPEYVCIGVTGYTDDEPRYHRRSHRWG